MHFVVIGLSHKTAPLEFRERLAFSEEKTSELLGKFLQEEHVQEGMMVSTCNRVEVYLVSRQAREAVGVATKLLSEWGGMAEETLAGHLYVKEAGEAVSHLFRVTSGLDSMVIGEPQIGGQIKEAYAKAVSCNATGVYLHKLVHRALHVSKKIRSETGIGLHPVSVSYAAVVLAEKIFCDLSKTSALLLGAGEMSELAAKHLAARNIREIRIANRTEDKASLLAARLNATSISYDEAVVSLDRSDIVIVSTAATDFLIHPAQVSEAMKKRKNRPMFFIDISVPRNIDPAVNGLEDVYLYDIDDLQGLVGSNLKERQKEAKKAEVMIAHETELFLEDMGSIALSPTIEQLSKKFDLIRKTELEKYLTRRPGLMENEREALEACTKAMVSKILHEPIIMMKTENGREGGPKYSEILRKLFGLE